MNWIQLRPILRDRFGNGFYFYNDGYRSGNRRVKICSYKNRSEIFNFIKKITPELDVKFYKLDSLTIHYKNI